MLAPTFTYQDYQNPDLVLRDVHGKMPRRAREPLAAILSPPAAVNRVDRSGHMLRHCEYRILGFRYA